MNTDAKATKQINWAKWLWIIVSWIITIGTAVIASGYYFSIMARGETAFQIFNFLIGPGVNAFISSTFFQFFNNRVIKLPNWMKIIVQLVILVFVIIYIFTINNGIGNSFLARAQQATTSSEIASNLKQAHNFCVDVPHFCVDVPQFVKEHFENVHGAPIVDANQEPIQQDLYVDVALGLHPEIISDDDLKEYVDLLKGRLDKVVDQSLWGNVQRLAYILAGLSLNDSVSELGLADDTQCKYFDKAVAQVAEDLANDPRTELARRYIDNIVVRLGANADCLEPNNNVLHDELLKYAKSKAIGQAIEYPVTLPVEVDTTPEAPTPTPQTNLPSIVETPVPDYQYTFSKPLMAGTHYEPMTYCSTSAVYDATMPRDKTITRLAIEGETLPLDVVINQYAVARVPGSMITTQSGAATTNDTCFVLVKAAYFDVNWNDVFSGLNGRQ